MLLRRALSTKVFGLPAVQAVIQHKWDTWARRVLIWEFALYVVWLLGYQAFIILFQVLTVHGLLLATSDLQAHT